jgi:DNA-binding MarR family transcriptional regulator
MNTIDDVGGTDAGKEALVEEMGDLVQRMYAQCRSESTEGWTELELTMPQLHTMALLSQGPQRMGVIAWRLNSSQSAATSMIDRLVDKDLVARVPDKDDRRVVACQLTESGREEMERLWRINRMRIAKMADYLTIEELRRVVEAMELLCLAGQRAQESADA